MSERKPDNVVILDPSYDLQRRTHRRDGLTAGEAELRASKVIDEYSSSYGEKLTADAEMLRDLAAGDAEPAELYKVAKEIQGLAGTFGYHTAGEICGVLCEYLDRIGTRDPMYDKVVRSQTDALRLSVTHDGEEPQHLDRLLEDIRRMIAVRYEKLKA